MSNEKPLFGRVVTAMVTPFDVDGGVDFDAAANLARYLVNNGSDGIVVSGTTGESPTLSHSEKVDLFRVIKDAVGGRAKIIAGAGSYNTSETIELSKAAERCGVDGLLLVAPYYNKPSQEGLFQHYTAVANAVSTPIILYNVPGRTVANVDAATVVRLSAHPRVVAVKEASMNLAQIGEIGCGAPELQIYSGSDEVNLPILALGGVGVISVISHIAGRDLSKMVAAFSAGDLALARSLHLRTLALTKAMFSFPSPGPTKSALVQLGVLANAVVRLPLVPGVAKETELVRAALVAYGLLPIDA